MMPPLPVELWIKKLECTLHPCHFSFIHCARSRMIAIPLLSNVSCKLSNTPSPHSQDCYPLSSRENVFLTQSTFLNPRDGRTNYLRTQLK
jgi:hypothetical protein